MSEERRRKQMERMAKEAVAKAIRKPLWKKIIGVGSAVLAVVSAVTVIELRTQIKVVPVAPQIKSEPFEVPFEITNEGYLPVKVKVFGYCQTYDTDSYHFEKTLTKDFAWKGGILGPKESETIVIRLVPFFGYPRRADLAIAINYKSFGVHSRDVHRFVGHYDRSWYWLSAPSSAIRKDLDEKAKQFGFITED